MQLPNIFEKPGNTKLLRAGETIFSAGDASDFMYIVKAGKVDIVKEGRIVETVEPDGFFGEMALVDSSVRSASALAQTDCELSPISEKQFLFMVNETPFFSLRVLRVLAARLRRA